MATRSSWVHFLHKVRYFSKRSDMITQKKRLNYELRSFVKEDTPAIVEIAAKSNLQICEESLASWSQYDPNGIKVAVTGSGKVIGQCSGINFIDEICFGGTLVVLEEYRDSGIGNELVSACFVHGGKRNKGLNCFEDKINTYKRFGFNIIEESFSSLEYESKSRLNVETLPEELPEGVELKKYEDSHLDPISTYDRAIIHLDRKAIIKSSCREKNTITLVALKNGICVGYGSVKLNILRRAKVGPLYADSPAVAQVMFKRLVQAMPNAEGFQALTLSNNPAANEMFRNLGLPIHGSLLRLYTKEKLIIDASKVFCQFDEEFSPF